MARRMAGVGSGDGVAAQVDQRRAHAQANGAPLTSGGDLTPSTARWTRAALPDGSASIHELLDVEIIEAGPERVVMRLPVDWKVHQPYGILHGGVSALLAESAASFGAALAAEPGRSVVGIELNASHLRSLRDGHLTAEATPVRVGPHHPGLAHLAHRRRRAGPSARPAAPSRSSAHRGCRRRRPPPRNPPNSE